MNFRTDCQSNRSEVIGGREILSFTILSTIMVLFGAFWIWRLGILRLCTGRGIGVFDHSVNVDAKHE